MDLVVGATGNLGGEICRRLVERGRTVRGVRRASSDPAAVDRLRRLGVELAEADLRDPQSLEVACNGAENVISTATAIVRPDGALADVDRQGHIDLIDAASAAAVNHFVYVSVTGTLPTSFPLAEAKRAAERHLIDSGLTYTILRPTNFQEVWLGPAVGFDYPNAKATIYGAGDKGISYISLGDVAEFAVLSLERSEAQNTVIELGGPEPVSPVDAVRIFEEVSGRTFDVQHVPREALQAQIESAEDPKQATFATLMLASDDGDPIDMSQTVATFPVRLQSVREYAQAVVGSS